MRLSIAIEVLSMATHPTSVTIKETAFFAKFTSTMRIFVKNPVSGDPHASPESCSNGYILLMILCRISTPVSACQPNSPNSPTFRTM